jgi:hypothetical protein
MQECQIKPRIVQNSCYSLIPDEYRVGKSLALGANAANLDLIVDKSEV